MAENVGRLKQLQYLNLALNNIERIENLEGTNTPRSRQSPFPFWSVLHPRTACMKLQALFYCGGVLLGAIFLSCGSL